MPRKNKKSCHPFIGVIKELDEFSRKNPQQAKNKLPKTFEEYKNSKAGQKLLNNMHAEKLESIFNNRKMKAEKSASNFTNLKKNHYKQHGKDNIDVILGGTPPKNFETPNANVTRMKLKYKAVFNEAEYFKILAYVKIAYKTEKIGIPEEEALKLTLMCGDLFNTIKYLTEFASANKSLIEATTKKNETFDLVHDACLFVLPYSQSNKIDKTAFKDWQELAKKNNNLTSYSQLAIFPA